MFGTGRLLRTGVVVLALVLGLTGCVDEAKGPEGQRGKNTLNISATSVDSLPFMAILQVGIDKGWFAEEGLHVSLYSGGGGGNTLRVVTTGDADMAIAGNTSVVLASRQRSANMTVIAPWFQVNDFSWIAPAGSPDEDLTLGYSSGGSSTELLVRGLQAKLGVDSQAVGGMGDNWTAAKAGRISAGWSMQPFTTAKTRGGAEIVVDAREQLGDLPADLVAVNNDYAEQKPENLRTFFRVAQRLNEYVLSQPDRAARDLAPLVDVSAPVMREALRDTPEPSKGYSLQVDPAGLRNLSDLMVEA